MSMPIRILAGLLLVALAALPARAAEVKPETDQQKVLYALGQAMARNLEQFILTPDEFKYVEAGLADAVLHRPAQVELNEYMTKVQALAKERQTAAAEQEKTAADAFVKKMAGEKGAKKFDSGLIMIEEKAGTGTSPAATDMVKVHYHGTLRDGSVFDSSVERGTPASFRLNGVSPCWTEALQKMKVGGKSKLVCPAPIAYGERGFPPKIRPNSALVFDVELIEIVKEDAAAPAAPAPAH
jgi:FKBP-type peptidyl-prolyl cis-trans isomerase FkpA